MEEEAVNAADFARIVAAQREYVNTSRNNLTGIFLQTEVEAALSYAEARIKLLEEAIKGFVATYADKWEMMPGCGDNVAQVLSSDVFKLEQALADQEATP